MAAVTFPSLEDALAVPAGTHFGRSSWWEITQDRIEAFADATGDHQWIHVDPSRAANGPFGTTIAHGYLTLSLAVPLVAEVLSVEGVAMGINYGTNRVRFPAPVPVGSRVRAAVQLISAEAIDGGAQLTLRVEFELEASPKPGCVAEVIYRYYLG